MLQSGLEIVNDPARYEPFDGVSGKQNDVKVRGSETILYFY
jgi:hypothetical protein